MGTVRELFEAFKTVHFRESLPVIITETGGEIVELVQGQLYQGKLSDGDQIEPYYADHDYAVKKAKMNSAPGYAVPDIKFTGALYENMRAEAFGDTFDIESSVEYANSPQILQYGPHLLEMSEESKAAYCENTLLPAIQSYITAKTGLIFE